MATELRDFQDILTDLDDGRLHEECAHQLREVVRAVGHTQQKGALTLRLEIKPEGRKCVVTAKVTPTMPAQKQGLTIFFADEGGTLRKEDPRQLPLRHIERPAAPLLSIDMPEKGA